MYALAIVLECLCIRSNLFSQVSSPRPCFGVFLCFGRFCGVMTSGAKMSFLYDCLLTVMAPTTDSINSSGVFLVTSGCSSAASHSATEKSISSR